MDINSIVADYLSKNSNVSMDRINEAIENLTSDCSYACYNDEETSIFVTDELTKEEFLDFCSNATGKDADDIAEDVDILFSILNTDTDGDGANTLSADELNVIERSNGDKDRIDSFSLWNNLVGYAEEKVNKEKSKIDGTSSSDKTGDTDKTGDDDGNVDGTSTPTSIADVDFDDPASIKAYVDSMINDALPNAEAVINQLLSNGTITQDQADLMLKAYEEAGDEASLGAAEQKDNTKEKQLAEQLYESMAGHGTSEDRFASIMNDTNISDADFVNVIGEYIQEYGSFIQDVDGDFSGKKEKEYQAQIANILLREAEAGNPDAIAILCREIQAGTAGMTGTADTFITTIMDSASNELIATLNKEYSLINNGASFSNDVLNDFSFGKKKRFEEKILNSIKSQFYE